MSEEQLNILFAPSPTNEFLPPAYAILIRMDTDPTTVIPNGSTDITQLPDISSMMNGLLGPIAWISIGLTVVMIALYVYSGTRRRRVEKAILDMQKILNEMNERDKARSTPASLPKTDGDRIIATEQPQNLIS